VQRALAHHHVSDRFGGGEHRQHDIRVRDSAGGFENAAAQYLAGSYLSGLGLFLDATEHFGELCKLSPTSPAPHEALGTVYTKVGLMDLAAAEFQQALALTREP